MDDGKNMLLDCSTLKYPPDDWLRFDAIMAVVCTAAANSLTNSGGSIPPFT